MRSLTRFCVAHRRLVLAVWVVLIVVVAGGASTAGSAYVNTFSLSGTQSFEAQHLLQRAAPAASGDRESVVFSVHRGTVTAAGVRRRAETTLDRLSRLPMVSSVVSPFTRTGAAQISRSQQVAFAVVTLRGEASDYDAAQARRLVDTARSGAGQGLDVAVSGAVAEQSLTQKDSSVAFGAIAALVVLFLLFGSVLAAILPLITAGCALGVGVSLIGLISHLLHVASFSSQLALLIGLGVGVDYALFIVTRFRQGLQAGLEVEAAIVEALDTSGRAVMFAGITVCIALLGMFALGVSFLYGVAIAAALVVACTVAAALTLLPALLGLLGPRLLGRRGRRQLARGVVGSEGTPAWMRWTRALQARPAWFAAVAVAVMVLIALPFFSLRLGTSDQGSDPVGSTTRQAYDALARGFGPGYNGPLQLVAEVHDHAQSVGFAHVLGVVGRESDVVSVTTPVTLARGATASGAVIFANVYPRGSPQAVSTSRLLSTLRHTVIPRAAAGTGVRVLVGGTTAVYADFASVLTSKLPFFIAIVVFLSFLLLAAVFRSLVIPLMAAAMNMLSVGAAFGVMVAVFQWGWGDSLLGIGQTGPIEPFLPVMMFAILFGLSMDYEVFLVSRIYEEWHHSRDNRAAIARGLEATGQTITAAASIMVLVFAAFILGDSLIIKMFGLGLAAAILLDGLIVRMVLVPALMTLTGSINWRLPRLLDRLLPHLNVEGSAERSPVAEPSPRTPAGDRPPVPSAT